MRAPSLSLLAWLVAYAASAAFAAEPTSPSTKTVRVAAAFPEDTLGLGHWQAGNEALIGDGDISRAAFRTRALENFVYLVVSQRGTGSMILSPQGKIIAEAQGADSLAIVDIDPLGGREGGDAMNQQRDMRARLFRERNPAAFGILSEPNPPVLTKVPATITEPEAVHVAQKVLTIGEEEFQAAGARPD